METGKPLPKKPLSGLWEILSGYRGVYFLSMILLSVAVGGETAGYLLIRRFVDSVIVSGDWTIPLVYFALTYVGIALIRGATSYASGRSSAFASEMTIRRVRNILFDHMQRLSFAYHDNMKTGELIQRSTSDVDSLRRFYSEQVRGIIRILLLIVINISTLLFLHWKLALLTIAIVPPMTLITWFFFQRIEKAYESYQKQGDNLSSILQENLAGVRIVRAFARKKYEEEKFEESNREKRTRGFAVVRADAKFWPVAETLGGVQFVMGVLICGTMVLRGFISIGTFIAYVGIAQAIIWPLQELGRLISKLSTTAVSYRRVISIINEEQEDLHAGVGEDRVRGEIQFREVSFSYDPEVPVLNNITFSCRSGERIALLGEPGSGKTSLVNLLPRFYDYTSGILKIDGSPIESYSRHFLRQQIGIVEQEPFLFSTDIRSNITYGVNREVTQEEIISAAKAAAIHESIVSFPNGYDTLVGERGVTLSGGQKQRLAIARTLLKDPAILILDDSTSAIDAETEEQIRDALKKLMQNRTTFIIAHRVQSLMFADQILVFKKGTIIQRGTHAQLIKKPGFYSKIFELQTRIDLELEGQLTHG